MPPGFDASVRKFLDECEVTIEEIGKLLEKNKIFLDRTVDVGIISRESAIGYGMTGPNLRASGVARDLRKDSPYLGYEKYDFDVPDRRGRRLLRALSDPDGGDAAVDPHLPAGARHHARAARST